MSAKSRRITDALGLTRRAGEKTTWREIVPVIVFVVVLRITADVIGTSLWLILAVAVVFIVVAAGIYALVLAQSEVADDSARGKQSSRNLAVFLAAAALLVLTVGAGSDRWEYSANWAIAAVALFLPSVLVFTALGRRTPTSAARKSAEPVRGE
jgi:predicted MFS family arabinose efflux permease